MKLYIFRPEGHGQYTLWVVAPNERFAKDIVQRYLREKNEAHRKKYNSKNGAYEYYESIEEYNIEDYEPGHIFENDNG